MKNTLSTFAFPCFLLGVLIVPYYDRAPEAVSDLNKINMIGCGPGSPQTIDTAANGKFIVPLPGWGAHSYSISTNSDSARFYFNQGLNMYYSYHMREARASFREAARFDPSCAMAYWGIALAMGPTYNFAHLYKLPKEAPATLELMNQAASGSSDKEQQLIAIMNRRYSADTADKQRSALNRAYAEGLQALLSVYPDDNDLKILYTDAVMLMHPWNFWNNDGSPKQWTPELVGLCENVLKKDPHHPGALHYYIHLTEASRHPEVALSSADVLQQLLPGVAHMVHMSSHEYERNGQFAKGVEANNRADDDLMHYDSLAKNLDLSSHVPHYFAVRAFCALSGGLYRKGMPHAMECRNSVTPDYENVYDQYLYMMPVLALVRLGKWAEILQDSHSLDPKWPYATLLSHFAKGMAFVHTGQLDSAASRLAEMSHSIKDPILTVRRIPFNSPLQGALIAENILSASIDFSRKDHVGAIAALQHAAHMEDSLIYTEPKDWMIPARQFLGAYLLQLKKPAAAEKVYREDLVWNPGNGWSLLGLCQSLKAQGKTKNIAAYRLQYLNAFSAADEIPPASVYMH